MLATDDEDMTETEQIRSRNLDRERAAGHVRLVKDYFSSSPTFPLHLFRRRFCMHRHLFNRIHNVLIQHNDYFLQRADATGLMGLSSLQKMTSAIRQLATGASADSLDEYLRLGESTSLECLSKFCVTVNTFFGLEYLRKPTAAEVGRILKYSASRGFPEMLGSIDCMHWQWHACPVGWAGQFQDRLHTKTVILEAVATYDLRIWHSFFGCPGSLNDINVLDQSHIFYDVMQGTGAGAQFQINGQVFNQPYYLADGIYPRWPLFVKTISSPTMPAQKYFAKRQEAARKDIKRAFGVLQARWHILKHPSRLWQRGFMDTVVTTCIILHNMVVEDEKGDVLECFDGPNVEAYIRTNPPDEDWQARFPEFLANRRNMKDVGAHHLLQQHLVDHLWAYKHREREN